MFPEPSVKSITKFIQIFLEIFVSNTMKGPIEKGFHITYHDMDQGQPGRSLFWRSYFLIMLMGFVNDVHSWKGIGTNLLAMIKMMLKKAFNRFSGNCFNRFHGNKSGSFSSVFNCYQYGLFPCGTTPSFSRLLAANVCVIKLYELIKKPINTIPMGHCCTYFFQHVPGSRPGYTNVF